MPGFDAVKEATKIEKLVRDFMSHQNDTSTPEASRQAMAADKSAIEKEMTSIWKSPKELEKLTVQLEKMTNETFSKQPNVSFDHDRNGHVTAMTFSPSRWTGNGFLSGDREDHQIVVKYSPETKAANLYETARMILKEPE